jgi:tetratricopeptide (TPR) repeat protein
MDFYGLSYLQVDISVYHGNSGGPLCNDRGEVIGVVTAISTDGQAIAVPITAAKPEKFGALKDRRPNREVSTRLLGMAEDLLKKAGPSNQVMHLFRSALIWDAGNPGLYSKIGQLNLSGRCYPAAIAYLTRSLQMQPWPERAEVYRNLGLALAGLRKPEEALTILKEGLDKFPLDNAELWGDLATILEQEKRPVEAAYSARIALKTYSSRAGEMNDLYRRMHAALSPVELARLRDLESDLDNHLGRLRATADQARRDGKAFLNADAERVISDMAGVQKETVAPTLDRIEPGKPRTTKMSDEELEIRFIRGRIEVAKEHVRIGKVDHAVEILEDLIKAYPVNPETEKARLALKIFKQN